MPVMGGHAVSVALLAVASLLLGTGEGIIVQEKLAKESGEPAPAPTPTPSPTPASLSDGSNGGGGRGGEARGASIRKAASQKGNARG